MCANHPIDPGDMLAPIPTAVPPEAEETQDAEDGRSSVAVRNCDLYRTSNEAWKAYNAIPERFGLPGYDAWLFEPAAPAGAEAAGEDCGNALGWCGYRVEEDAEGGRFACSLATPFEGASVSAGMGPRGGSGRVWGFCAGILNNRGIGWNVSGEFRDMGRYVAKSLLVSMALELRRAYNHRGQKIRKRAIRRAIERKEGAGND